MQETISYEGKQEMKDKLENINNEKNHKKSQISIDEVFAKKNNFKRMVETGEVIFEPLAIADLWLQKAR